MDKASFETYESRVVPCGNEFTVTRRFPSLSKEIVNTVDGSMKFANVADPFHFLPADLLLLKSTVEIFMSASQCEPIARI